ncbi:basic salivary proline-rich protein 1-like [Sciurus carolinensis]|uniref:basic salivary proline-rich protein 1-like n=1 Tax=Sciurus carolinensis TaxID=30640 RepID=UPI001FB2A9DD|nr:basic salivary proline-rich protein 1-like [Sciurus carolinensis]
MAGFTAHSGAPCPCTKCNWSTALGTKEDESGGHRSSPVGEGSASEPTRRASPKRAREESGPQECRVPSPRDVECPGQRGRLQGSRPEGCPGRVTALALTSTFGLLLPPPVPAHCPRETPCSRNMNKGGPNAQQRRAPSTTPVGFSSVVPRFRKTALKCRGSRAVFCPPLRGLRREGGKPSASRRHEDGPRAAVPATGNSWDRKAGAGVGVDSDGLPPVRPRGPPPRHPTRRQSQGQTGTKEDESGGHRSSPVGEGSASEPTRRASPKRAREESGPQECRVPSPRDVECPGQRGRLQGSRPEGCPGRVTALALTSTFGLLLPPPVPAHCPRETPCSRNMNKGGPNAQQRRAPSTTPVGFSSVVPRFRKTALKCRGSRAVFCPPLRGLRREGGKPSASRRHEDGPRAAVPATGNSWDRKAGAGVGVDSDGLPPVRPRGPPPRHPTRRQSQGQTGPVKRRRHWEGSFHPGHGREPAGGFEPRTPPYLGRRGRSCCAPLGPWPWWPTTARATPARTHLPPSRAPPRAPPPPPLPPPPQQPPVPIPGNHPALPPLADRFLPHLTPIQSLPERPDPQEGWQHGAPTATGPRSQ